MHEFLESPHYDKAPIAEAVIDLRLGVAIKKRTQDKLVKKIARSYYRFETLQAIDVNIDTTGGSVRVDQALVGHRIASEDQLDLVTVQPNRLTVSRLAPYPGWEALEERAKDTWNTWRDLAGNSQINRVGVRFINRFDLPVEMIAADPSKPPGVNLSDYLTIHISDPVMNHNPMDNYLLQITRDAKMPNWKHSITSTVINPAPLINHMSILLDIDVFRTQEIPLHPDRLWDVVSEARKIKNDIFERCITNATRELIS